MEFNESGFIKLSFADENVKKRRCWACGVLGSIKWGRQNGKQRYKCKNCGILFTATNPQVSKANQLVWFRKWVIERLTYRYLAKDSGLSRSTLKRLFQFYLTYPPIFLIHQSEKAHLLIDGTYLSNDLCLVIYRDNDFGYTQLYRFSDAERFEQICEDLKNLSSLGVQVASITCDGHKATLKAIKVVYPDVVVQRCVVHVHRMANIWLRQKPKTQASLELKRVVQHLPLVKTHNDKKAFIGMFEQWYCQHKEFVNEKAWNRATGRWWYRHRDPPSRAFAKRCALFFCICNARYPLTSILNTSRAHEIPCAYLLVEKNENSSFQKCFYFL